MTRVVRYTGRRPCEDRSRDQRCTTKSQGVPGIAGNHKLEGTWKNEGKSMIVTPGFRLLAFRNVRPSFSCAVAQAAEVLYWQPLKMNTDVNAS